MITLALDASTGKLQWYFSHAPGESFDLDVVDPEDAPGTRVTFDQPSAAKAAVCSWRVSMRRIPSARQPS